MEFKQHHKEEDKMITATERYKLINNITARVGIDGDIISELSKVESMINSIEQGKMTPPPLPPELNNALQAPLEGTGGTMSPEMGGVSPQTPPLA